MENTKILCLPAKALYKVSKNCICRDRYLIQTAYSTDVWWSMKFYREVFKLLRHKMLTRSPPHTVVLPAAVKSNYHWNEQQTSPSSFVLQLFYLSIHMVHLRLFPCCSRSNAVLMSFRGTSWVMNLSNSSSCMRCQSNVNTSQTANLQMKLIVWSVWWVP